LRRPSVLVCQLFTQFAELQPALIRVIVEFNAGRLGTHDKVPAIE
jgi:hypothetical protein